MTQVVIIRHGRTEWNRVERFRGRTDLMLDEVGIRQAKATAERVANWPVSAVYCSPLKRTLATAGIIAQRLNLEAIPLPGIIDIDFGDWQGLSPEEAASKNKPLFTIWLKDPHKVQFPNGESLAEVRQRAALAVDRVVKQNDGKTIALVSHRVVCQILTLHFLGLDNSRFWQISQDVSAVNLFEVDENGAHALLINDTCHLRNQGLG